VVLRSVFSHRLRLKLPARLPSTPPLLNRPSRVSRRQALVREPAIMVDPPYSRVHGLWAPRVGSACGKRWWRVGTWWWWTGWYCDLITKALGGVAAVLE